MSSRRLTTIHDVTALRVHPDGTRIPADGSTKGKRRDKRVVQDSRGNWTAQDAAGPIRIKRRRAAGSEGEDDGFGGTFDLTGVGELTQNATDREHRGELDQLGQSPIDVPKPNKRSKKEKRQRFQDDMTFLTATSNQKDYGFEAAAIPSQGPSLQDLATISTASDPSSVRSCSLVFSQKLMRLWSQELLKCIHHMASQYYHEMGQLEDVTREVRKERRRQRRLKVALAATGSSSHASTNVRSESVDDSSDEDPGSGGEDASSMVAPEDVDVESSKYTGEDRSVDLFGERGHHVDSPSHNIGELDIESVDGWKEVYADQDMYKMFDGSALIVIGMSEACMHTHFC